MASTYQQANRALSVLTPLGKDELLLTGFRGSDALSHLFSYRLDLLAENKKTIAFDSVLGQKCTVTFRWGKDNQKKRYFNGICSRISQGERNPEFTRYYVELVPFAWLLTRKAQSRIFQRLSVPDILKKVLTAGDVSFDIQGSFQPRDFCVQYRETDFNFASRLMEEEGIYYYFTHVDGNHTMVVTNSPSGYPATPEQSDVPFEEQFGGPRDELRVSGWEKVQELRSGKYTVWDHCFELPHKHLEADKTIQDSVSVGSVSHKLKVGGNDKLELYDFPGEYAQRFDGIDKGGGEQPGDLQKIFEDNKRTVEIRMQQEAVQSLEIGGKSNCRQFVSGHKFSLQRHFNADGPYVLTSVHHVMASTSSDYRAGGGQTTYKNTFTCIPIALPFRPQRATPKPVVQGTQTAVVVGPKDEEIFTDKYGRVKVQFHWDREGKNDPESSCWIRVATAWGGKMWGAVLIPRIGQEVVVDFLEGDPDQPIVIGSVYNADMMPPYKLPAMKTQSGLKSRSTLKGEPQNFNEIRFEDKKGKEQVFVHAERNEDVLVKNDSMESVYHDKHLTVGAEKDGKKQGDYRELAFQDVHLHNKRHLEQHVGGDMKLLVGGEDGDGKLDLVVKDERKTLVEKSDHLHVKGSSKEKVDGDVGLTVGGSFESKIGEKLATEAGQEIHLKAGMKIVIEAGSQLTLKGPGGFIDIGPSGVAIQGTMVQINSGGSAGSGSGSSPASPDDAKEANPQDPTAADNAKTGY